MNFVEMTNKEILKKIDNSDIQATDVISSFADNDKNISDKILELENQLTELKKQKKEIAKKAYSIFASRTSFNLPFYIQRKDTLVEVITYDNTELIFRFRENFVKV